MLSAAQVSGHRPPRGAVPGMMCHGKALSSGKKHSGLASSRPWQSRMLTPAWGGGGQRGCWPAPPPPAPLSLGRCGRRAVHGVLQQRRGPGGAAAGLFLRSLGREQLLGAGGGGNRPAFHRPAWGPGKWRSVQPPNATSRNGPLTSGAVSDTEKHNVASRPSPPA